MTIKSCTKKLQFLLLFGIVMFFSGHAIQAKVKNKSTDELTLKKPNLAWNQQQQWFDMVGKTYLDQPSENSGRREILSNRFLDGTYEFVFRTHDENGNYTDSVEVGEWGVSEGIYFTIFKGWMKKGKFKRADNRDPYNRDVYKIITLNENVFIYESLDGKTRYSSKQVSDDFVLKKLHNL